MYAVIAFQGHQYIVKQGDELVVDKLDAKKGETVSVDTVLLTFDEAGKKTKIGTPYVDKAAVKLKVKAHTRGDKIRVFKFQGKKRYHKTKGFKAHQSILSVESV